MSAIAPSRIDGSPYTLRPGFADNYHEATEEEILQLITGFGDAAARAQDAGFDAVEVHGAHDSLLAQFRSPVTNRRIDDWRGSVENRVRIHCEVARAIRDRVGDGYPVILKIGAADGIPGGLPAGVGREAAVLCS
jgi:NADPH2 dehydrogenase